MLAIKPLDMPLEEKIVYLDRIKLSQKLKVDERVISYNGHTYHRYMDRFYTYNLPSDMCREEVDLLSSLRIEKDAEVIDYDYTKSVIAHLLEIAVPEYSPIKLIDFGCGNGILAEVIKEKNIKLSSLLGLDLSPKAVDVARKTYLKNGLEKESKTQLFYVNDKIEVEDDSVDSIVSSFVMHFPVYKSQLKEFYRALKHKGTFVYNDYVYNRQTPHYRKTIKLLREVGFECSEETFKLKSSYNNRVGYHKVVTCIKV